MANRDVEISAAGMRKRTARGKKRAEETRITKLRLEEERRKSISRKARETVNSKKYAECRAKIREAADEGGTSTTFRVASGYGRVLAEDDFIRVRVILEELKNRLIKAGFKVSMSWPQEEESDMGDFSAPCLVSQYAGHLDISWS